MRRRMVRRFADRSPKGKGFRRRVGIVWTGALSKQDVAVRNRQEGNAPAGDESRAYRDALARFATGITVVTMDLPGVGHHGMTVNSFSSVSLDPPLVLFCVGKGAKCHDPLEQGIDFSISVLPADREDLSTHFAMTKGELFQDVACDVGTLGLPLLSDRIAAFECRGYASHPAGDHTIIIGEVVRFEHRSDGEPLIYFGSRYRQLG